MNRLTEKDDQGNWHLKGVRWEQLHEGQVITGELREKLYGALWKLMEYEDTGLSPEERMRLIWIRRRRTPPAAGRSRWQARFWGTAGYERVDNRLFRRRRRSKCGN